MTDKLFYDKILIGSSPASMMEAISLSHKGNRVLVIEKNDRIGGAWSTIDLPEGKNFEANCHILLGSKEAYTVMNNFLGWSMEYVRPQPKIWIKGRKFHYNSPLRFIIRFFQNIIRLIRKNKYYGDKNLKINVSGRSLNFSSKKILENSIDEMLNGNIYYPREGTPEMMEKLSEKFKNLGGQLNISERVQNLEVDFEKPVVTIQTTKSKYFSSEAIITNGSEIESIIIGSKRQDINSRSQNSIQIYMFLEDNQAPLISYILLFNHPILHRISEMNKSSLSKAGFGTDKRLFVVQLRNSFVHNMDSSVLPSKVLEALVEADFASSNCKIVSSYLVDYPANYKDEGALDRLSLDSKGRIRVLPVDDLSKTILELYKKNFT